MGRGSTVHPGETTYAGCIWWRFSVHSSRDQVSGLGRRPPATFTSSASVLGGSLYFCPDSAKVGLGFHLPKPRGERSGLGLPMDIFLLAPSAFACKSK